jgi:hypothetical protein
MTVVTEGDGCLPLTRAGDTCLVTNSLKVRPHPESVVEVEEL